MLTPDLALARRFLAAHPPPGRMLLCGVTGSHFYGFPSPDSDLDLKAIHLAPTEAVLGLGAPPETFDVLTDFEGIECDLLVIDADGERVERHVYIETRGEDAGTDDASAAGSDASAAAASVSEDGGLDGGG